MMVGTSERKKCVCVSESHRQRKEELRILVLGTKMSMEWPWTTLRSLIFSLSFGLLN